MNANDTPVLSSIRDLTIVEAWDPDTNTPRYATFYHVTADEEVFFGQTTKNKRDLSLEEYQEALQRVPDEEIYPAIPGATSLTIAPSEIHEPVFVKRPGLNSYETMKGTPYVPKALLDETLVMERLSKAPHPNIVLYLGCRVRRNRITAIVLQLHQYTLSHYVSKPDYQELDKDIFLQGIESAVAYLHSLGLAHNDINPDNIMIGPNQEAILIDFGSCAPFGMNLQDLGTEGWYEELCWKSEKKNDEFPLRKLKEWLRNPE